MSSVPPAANIGNAFSPQKSFAACDDQSFPHEEERVWTPRSLNQQQDGARREQSVSDSKREALHTVQCGVWSHSVERCRAEQQLGAWLLFPAESAAAQPTAVVRLALVRAQSTLCSSKRQSARWRSSHLG